MDTISNQERAEAARRISERLPLSSKQVYRTLKDAEDMGVDWRPLKLDDNPEQWDRFVSTYRIAGRTGVAALLAPEGSWAELISRDDGGTPAEKSATLGIVEKLLELHELNIRNLSELKAQVSALSQELTALRQRTFATDVSNRNNKETPKHLPFQVSYRVEGETSVDAGHVFEAEGMVDLLQKAYSFCSRNRGKEMRFDVTMRGRWITTFKYNGGGSLRELDAGGRFVCNLVVWKSRSEL